MDRVKWIVYCRLKKKYPNWTKRQLMVGVKYALAPETKGVKNGKVF